MSWTLDATTPTLDTGGLIATFDGWSAELSAFIVSATVVIGTEILRTMAIQTQIAGFATVPEFIDMEFVWPMT